MIKSSYYNWFTCKSPQLITNRYTGEIVQVPCGKCSACRVHRITRYLPFIAREASCYHYHIFFTLTYNEENLPLVDLSTYYVEPKYKEEFDYYFKQSSDYIEFCNNLLPIAPSCDIQKFLKRFRQRVSRSLGYLPGFRYFISSDYGNTTFRPHWHGLFFFSDKRLYNSIEKFIFESWSLYDKVLSTFTPIGRIDVQDSFNAGSYVACYVSTSSFRPSIYQFRDFRVKHYHSSHPSFGSLCSPRESDKEILFGGLSEIHLFSPTTNIWEKRSLPTYLVRRLFPQISGFNRLSKSVRLCLYRWFASFSGIESESRRLAMYQRYLDSSFVSDYINMSFDKVPTYDQIIRKFDVTYYIVCRLISNCFLFNISLSEYDDYINLFLHNRAMSALKKQFLFEDMFILETDDVDLCLSLVDRAYSTNRRRLVNFYPRDRPKIEPFFPDDVDVSYFRDMDTMYNKLIKRKRDNAYLELHPEYKQFHS